MFTILNYLNRLPIKYSVWFTISLSIVCSFLVYGLYGIHAIDDAWTLSFDYFYYYEGFEFDRVFERGLGIVAYFGKLHAYLYGTILDIVGWQRNYAQFISILLIGASAYVWYHIAKICGYEKYYAMAVGALILLLDPFMSVAHKARPEALTFLLLSLTILSFYRNCFLLAGILAGFAIESHPMGAISLAYLSAAILSKHNIKSLIKHKRMIINIALGLGIGLLFYLLLHGQHLTSLFSHSSKGDGPTFTSSWFLYQHFFESRYHRHLPEFFIWLIGIGVFVHKKLYITQTYRFALLSLIFVLIFSLLFPHGNKQYGIYLYPAFILIAISIAQHYKKLTLLLLLFCTLMLPQYTFVYWKFKGFDFQEYTKFVHNATPNNQLPIWGHPNHWFAFNKKSNSQTRNFYSGAHQTFQKTNELIYIRDIAFEKYQPLKKETIQLLESHQSKLLNTSHYKNHIIKIYHVKK